MGLASLGLWPFSVLQPFVVSWFWGLVIWAGLSLMALLIWAGLAELSGAFSCVYGQLPDRRGLARLGRPQLGWLALFHLASCSNRLVLRARTQCARPLEVWAQNKHAITSTAFYGPSKSQAARNQRMENRLHLWTGGEELVAIFVTVHTSYLKK